MYLAYTAPHWPLHAWPEDIAKYQGRFMKGWDALRKERYERMKNLGLLTPGHHLSPRDEGIPDWESLSEEKKKEMDLKMAIYAAQIDRMDQGIGKVLQQLKKSGKANNTLVMFLSDNGACAETGVYGKDWRKNGLSPGGADSYMSYGRAWANASNTPYRLYKKWCHEGGTRTPFIVHWPGNIEKPGGFARTPTHIIDIMATCKALGQAGYPEEVNNKPIIGLEGHDLTPLFQDEKTFVEHEVLAWEHYGNRAVRAGGWKLVAEDGKDWDLYNVLEDPVELNNLVKKQPAKADSMKKLYKEWAGKMGI
jgi:arylsulfatase